MGYYFESLTLHDYCLAINFIYMNTVENKESGCWLWQGRLNKDGYAQGKFLGLTFRIHRFVYQLHHNHNKTLPKDILGSSRSCKM